MSEPECYFSPREPAYAEYRQRDSRFLAYLAPATDVAIAENTIKEYSEGHADATHNCWAYRLGVGDQCRTRVQDAGEPAGTAGRPILKALEAKSVSDAVLVVSRYFGGTKLGIGGLMRAYAAAAHAVLSVAELSEVRPQKALAIAFDFDFLGKIHQAIHRHQATILETAYQELVHMRLSVPVTALAALKRELMDATRGKLIFK